MNECKRCGAETPDDWWFDTCDECLRADAADRKIDEMKDDR